MPPDICLWLNIYWASLDWSVSKAKEWVYVKTNVRSVWGGWLPLAVQVAVLWWRTAGNDRNELLRPWHCAPRLKLPPRGPERVFEERRLNA